eukprot:scaffold417_cov252-Pinguiococcus_pyrenoidosus.AAC.26
MVVKRRLGLSQMPSISEKEQLAKVVGCRLRRCHEEDHPCHRSPRRPAKPSILSSNFLSFWRPRGACSAS